MKTIFQHKNQTVKLRLKLSLKISTRELSTLELKSYKKHIKGYITAYHLSNSINSSLFFSSSSEPIVGVRNEDTKMQYVVFHLFNFKEICVNNGIYSKHVHLEADNWVVELKSLAESENNFKKLKKEGKISVPISGGCQTKVTYRNIFRLWEVFSIR
ncbi:MAG: hypothetical protein QG646_4641 [Euryarchaeota archaeon]|nr:hypothetical protein [Euryarchaeota archaeon]